MPFDSVRLCDVGQRRPRGPITDSGRDRGRGTPRGCHEQRRAIAGERSRRAGRAIACRSPRTAATVAEDDDSDPLAGLKADIAKAKGSRCLLETTAGGWGEAHVNAPRQDWKAARLGPNPPEAFGKVAQSSFNRFLAAAGVFARAVRRGRRRHRHARELAAMAYGRGAADGARAGVRAGRQIRRGRDAEIRQLPDGHGFAGASVLEARRGRRRLPGDGAGAAQIGDGDG